MSVARGRQRGRRNRDVFEKAAVLITALAMVLGQLLFVAAPAEAATWVPQYLPTLEDSFAVDFPVDAVTGYAVGRNGSTLRTFDGGGSWSSGGATGTS
ncbi:MAG: hypothetical protein HKO03_12270, partial [Acidimicrobiia bacterium]|nr:hypothetical protein [Acidimicrobiia bacterium]